MQREILLQIIREKLFFDLIFNLGVFFLINLVNIKLIYRILGIQVRFRQIWPGVLLLILYNLVGKQILPPLAYGLVLVILLIILVKAAVKKAVSWIRCFWAAFLAFFITSLGVLAIQMPLWLNKDSAFFLEKTPTGSALGALCEAVFPLIVLFLLSTLDISLIPVKRKINLLDWLNLYLFGWMFSLFYITAMRVFENIEAVPNIL